MRNPTETDAPGIVQIKIDVTDPASITAAATQCSDTTVLVNNAGIGRLTSSTLDSAMIVGAREVFETNFYGTILVSQAFAPILAKNGGGAIINVLSDASWLARPILGAYSASNSAVWSFTNALRVELRNQKTLVLGLHAGFMDTDMTQGFEMRKLSPRQVAEAGLIGIESNKEEVLADAFTREVKRSLCSEQPMYMNPPEIA